MSSPSINFKDKAKEIDLYFDFLKKVVVNEASLTLPRKGNPSAVPFDAELQKILKANAIILLYNLIESSIRSGLVYIYDSIATEGVNYRHLRKELQVLWLENWIKPDPTRSFDASTKKIYALIERILAAEVASFDTDLIPIRGNLDAMQIRKLSEKYGFSARTRAYTHGGDLLVLIKNGRNDLAHGIKSFTEYGRDLTFDGLMDMKSQVEKYIREILKNMERYVKGRKFQGSSRTKKIV